MSMAFKDSVTGAGQYELNSKSGDQCMNVAAMDILISGEDQVANVLLTEAKNTYKHIAAAADTVCVDAATLAANGSAWLEAIIIGAAVDAFVITVYDNVAASGTVVSILTVDTGLITPVVIPFRIRLASGLSVKTAGTGTPDITVVYR